MGGGLVGAAHRHSAPNICLMLGYNFTLALRLTLLGTVLPPLFMPLSLAVAGVAFQATRLDVALRVFAMLFGGIVLGTAMQMIVTRKRLRENDDILNGGGETGGGSIPGFGFGSADLGSGAEPRWQCRPARAELVGDDQSVGGFRRLCLWQSQPDACPALLAV